MVRRFAEYGFQQTRGFRALKLWAALLQSGRDGLSLIIRRHNRLALRLAEAIDASPDLERLAPVSLSIVCFRFHPPEQMLSDEALDLLNQRIMEGLQEQGEVFLTHTTLRGRFALRACILHYGTSDGDVDHLVTCPEPPFLREDLWREDSGADEGTSSPCPNPRPSPPTPCSPRSANSRRCFPAS